MTKPRRLFSFFIRNVWQHWMSEFKPRREFPTSGYIEHTGFFKTHSSTSKLHPRFSTSPTSNPRTDNPSSIVLMIFSIQINAPHLNNCLRTLLTFPKTSSNKYTRDKPRKFETEGKHGKETVSTANFRPKEYALDRENGHLSQSPQSPCFISVFPLFDTL